MPEAFVAEMEKARHAEALSEYQQVVARIESVYKRPVLHIGLNGDFTFAPTEIVAEMDEDAELVEADRAPFVADLAALVAKHQWIPPEYEHASVSGTLSDKI